MNLPLPNLDDQSYGDLVQEAIALIPLEYPEWTDHNPTDTGIILIELFAWLTEMMLYQVNQIPDQNYASFLSLLKVEKWNLPNESAEEKQKQLQLEIRKTLLQLRETYRAVTIEDYEKLILEEWQNSIEFTEKESIARVHCLPLRNQAQTNAKAHITLVVVNKNEQEANEATNSYPNLFKFLDQRRLLTTRIHLVDPKYIFLNLETTLVIEDGIKPEALKEKAEVELKNYFDPRQSGKYWQGKGYPFGRNVYLSELYQLLDNLSGVDYVKQLILRNPETVVTEIKLDDDQLIKLQSTKITIEVKVGNESREV